MNTKLGQLIHSWSLPAGREYSCPGSSDLCEKYCYAKTFRFRFGATQATYLTNWGFSKSNRFVAWMISSLRSSFVRIMRLHVSGDFYSAAYVRKWIRIARLSPSVRFFGYTRSWRDPAMLPALRALAALPNVQLWFSYDNETGRPPKTPRVRRAYMAADQTVDPASHADLVFRVNRRKVEKRVAGVVVCPHENGSHQPVTCSSCAVCWAPAGEIAETRRLVSLPVI